MANENFIDYIKIFCIPVREVRLGTFSTSARTPKGVGWWRRGKGGDVILKGIKIFGHFYIYDIQNIFLPNGENGQQNQRFGRQGKNAVVESVRNYH